MISKEQVRPPEVGFKLLPATLKLLETPKLLPPGIDMEAPKLYAPPHKATASENPGEGLSILTLRSDHHQQQAAQQVLEGQPVIIQLTTYGLLTRITTPEDAHPTDRIKQIDPEHKKPLTLAIDDLDKVLSAVDLSRIDNRLWHFFSPEHRSELDRRLASTTIVRVPVRQSAVINGVPVHDRIVSTDEKGTPWLQFLYFGHRYSQKLIEKLYQHPNQLFALTSLNITGNPTVDNPNDAISFARERRINTILSNPQVDQGLTKRTSSYPIITLDLNGVSLARMEGMNLKTDSVQSLWPEIFPQTYPKKDPLVLPHAALLNLIALQPDSQKSKVVALFNALTQPTMEETVPQPELETQEDLEPVPYEPQPIASTPALAQAAS